MNFLVHAWLSYPNRDLTWGNLYADAFKGSSFKILSDEKAKGVAFHRQIDYLTDEHAIVKEIIQSIRPIAGKMAPIYVDVAFDYWLHKHLENSENDITQLIDFVHEVLQSDVPEKGKMTRMLPFLLSEQWLTRYGTYDGISAAMNGLNYRMSMKYDVNKVLEALLSHDGLMAQRSSEMFEYLKNQLTLH